MVSIKSLSTVSFLVATAAAGDAVCDPFKPLPLVENLSALVNDLAEGLKGDLVSDSKLVEAIVLDLHPVLDSINVPCILGTVGTLGVDVVTLLLGLVHTLTSLL